MNKAGFMGCTTGPLSGQVSNHFFISFVNISTTSVPVRLKIAAASFFRIGATKPFVPRPASGETTNADSSVSLQIDMGSEDDWPEPRHQRKAKQRNNTKPRQEHDMERNGEGQSRERKTWWLDCRINGTRHAVRLGRIAGS